MSMLTTPRVAPGSVAPTPQEAPWTLDRLGPPLVAFAVYGTPGPQGSKSFKGMRKGKPVLAESSKKVKPWRDAVYSIAKLHAPTDALDGALVADMVFTLDKPQRFPTGDLRRIHGRPTAYPDVSKLARSTEDAMTGVVWADDARVIAYRRLTKLYVGDSDPDVLRKPGVVVRVWEVQ